MELQKEEPRWELHKTSPASSSALMRLGAEHPTCPEAPNSIREVDRGHQQEQCEAHRMENKIRSSVHYTTEEVGQDNHLQYTKHCCEEGEGNNLLSMPQRTGAEWWAVVMERQAWAGHQIMLSAVGVCKHGARLPANNAKPLLLAAPQHRSNRHW